MASNVLRDVAKYKRSQLAERKTTFEKRKAQLLKETKQSDGPINTLLQGLEKLGFNGTTEPVSIDNIRLMHGQSVYDSSVPTDLIIQWENDLKRLLDIQTTKYEYAGLFSELATEWVDKPNEANVLLGAAASDNGTTTPTSEDSQAFESVQVGREEMHEQRQQWDSLVFTERPTDTAAIEKYLADLFSDPRKKKRVEQTPFEYIRSAMKEIGSFKKGVPFTCTADDVKFSIKAVLKADLFSGSKRDELIGLRDARPAVRKEVADVINMELANLEDWEWKPSPIPAHMRRQLNGKYRVYMDSEIHQALLIQWIGIHFATSVKRIFKAFFRTNAWPKSVRRSMNARDHVRAAYYLGDDKKKAFNNSVLHERRDQWRTDHFMTQLPSGIREGTRDYIDPDRDEESESEYEGKSPLEVKQMLLRLATTELVLQKKIYGSFTLCQTDFKWFGPSLPHNTIFTVLKFLGVQEIWLDFFKKFLSMTLIFPQDGPAAEARTRRCGVPISQVLSDVFGETILACLDYAVSKATHGRCQLYRFHDDVWFWGQKEDCETAWQTIKTFTDVMGLSINEEKTGSVQISDGSGKESAILPKGPVRWGFLVLDPVQSRWVVDMEQVDKHIVEMRRQFAQCRSVFSWVQAWNSYIGRFLSNNFGHPAKCLGTQHLDMIFSTFKHIQEKLFTDKESNMGAKDVTSYLKSTIGQRFGADNIANAFIYWPIEFGGLELRNPFIPLMTVRSKLKNDPAALIDRAFEEDEELYENAKSEFEHNISKHRSDAPKGCDPEHFFSFDEFVRFREETSQPLCRAYKQLLQSPEEEGVEFTRRCGSALESIPAGLRDPKLGSKAFQTKWPAMSTYWKWILQLYAGEAMDRFGGLMLGEKEMLPVELVNLMMSERVRWQG